MSRVVSFLLTKNELPLSFIPSMSNISNLLSMCKAFLTPSLVISQQCFSLSDFIPGLFLHKDQISLKFFVSLHVAYNLRNFKRQVTCIVN